MTQDPLSLFTTRLMEKRKRKTKEPCPRCFLHLSRCLCSEIRSLVLATKVTLIIHHRELKRTTNTGRLALEALKNSNCFVRGKIGEPLDFSKILEPNFQPLLLSPGDSAQELSLEFLKKFQGPFQLLVPDGNWRQASKISIRSSELKTIPRVQISVRREATQFLRKETKKQGMSTLEAIAEALGFLESEMVRDQLLSLYDLKLRRTLQGRGQLDAE